jgi:iron complex outermembrane receptor protein
LVKQIRLHIQNTSNATLREKSPTEFDAGGLGFSQNTTNFDVRKFDKLNVVWSRIQK